MRLVYYFVVTIFACRSTLPNLSFWNSCTSETKKKHKRQNFSSIFMKVKESCPNTPIPAFAPQSETLKFLSKIIVNKIQADSVVITVMNVQYIHEKSVHMFGSGPGQFREGKSIKGDNFNQIYIVDTAQEAVLKFNEKLQFLDKFSSSNIDESQSFEKDFANRGAQFDGINDLIATPRLTTFITDTRNQRVVEVDSSGNFVREFNPRDGFDTPNFRQIVAMKFSS